uniref:G protein-coupled receptor n=1 Tax=Romanomermis culicivorax TaxID=13658 RepID=A0A915IX51_ROMCU
MQIWHMFAFFTSPMIVSHCISLYCAFSISKLISNQTQAKNDREWFSKIREAKFIIRFIYIEVFLPICMETPVFVLIFINRYFSPIPREVMAFWLGCFVVHGTSDPIVMVMVIKPYRRLIKGCFSRVWPMNAKIGRENVAVQHVLHHGCRT